MNKKILVIAGPSIPVPPTLYGGTERIIAMVNEGLLARGYQIDMMAGPSSKSYGGRLFLYYEPGQGIKNRVLQRLRFYYGSFMLGLSADLVINCGRLDYMKMIFLLGKKVINPFHNPLTQHDISTIKKYRRLIWPVGISHDQTSEYANLNFKTIYNSADSSGLTYDRLAVRTYFVFIGRLIENKGIDKAIQLAIKSEIHLKIAGPIPDRSEADINFFNASVRPFLDNQFIEYVGIVDEQQKNELFRNAIASFFPISWKEPFGLTVIESLLCGVPVIASDMASIPEIMEADKTGFLCRTEADFLNAIQKIHLISNDYCRDYSIVRYNKERMVNDYVSFVEQVITAKYPGTKIYE